MIHSFYLPRTQDNRLGVMWKSPYLPCLSSWQRCRTLLSRMILNPVTAASTRFSPLLSPHKTTAVRPCPVSSRRAALIQHNLTYLFKRGKKGKGKFICSAQFNMRQLKVFYINITSGKTTKKNSKTKQKTTKNIAKLIKKKSNQIKDANYFYLCGIGHMHCGRRLSPHLQPAELMKPE